MSTLDILMAVVLVVCILASAFWGAIRQVIAVGGLLVGLWLAGAYNEQVAGYLSFLNDSQAQRGLAFVLIVVLVSVVASAIASVLYFVSGLLFFGVFDHLAGAVLGLFQGVIMMGVFLVGTITLFPQWSQQQLNQSIIANHLAGGFTSLALLVAPPELKATIQQALTLARI
jgi:membrane protein required for colicin V production